MSVRDCCVLACLALGCGRIAFDATGSATDGATEDATDACTLGPFGAPERVPGINSTSDDWAATVTADERIMFVASWRGNVGRSQIWEARRADASLPFEPATLVAEVDQNANSEQTPALSADGRLLIVSSNRTGTMGSYDLFAFERPDLTTPFGAPQVLDGTNSSAFDNKPWLSRDGLRVYFTSTRGTGERNLYVAARPSVADRFDMPLPITELDIGAHEAFPCLSDDELEIYFSSDRPDGMGRADVWFATRMARDQPFGPVENLAIVNTPNDDLPNWLSADGRTLYLNHDALESGGRGQADIWTTRRTCQ